MGPLFKRSKRFTVSILFLRNFKAIKASFFATRHSALSFWPKRLPSLDLAATTYMPKCCNLIETEFFMTSVLDFAGTWFAQICLHGVRKRKNLFILKYFSFIFCSCKFKLP